MDMFTRAVSLLPEELNSAAMKYTDSRVEEIRLRMGKAPTLLIRGQEWPISGKLLGKRELEYVLERASGASMHAYMDEIVQGYMNFKGLRIGLCGTVILKGGELTGFKNFSSLSIRIPAVFEGDIDAIYTGISGALSSTLIVSAPGGGKTTLLRELIRRFSYEGRRVCVVDERNEISASEQGRAYYDMGEHSDVMVGVGKKDGAMLMLRTMNPQIIALDEISREDDMDAVMQCVGCGVAILATAHGSSLRDIKKRRLYRSLLDEHIFDHLISIESTAQGRCYHYERLSK